MNNLKKSIGMCMYSVFLIFVCLSVSGCVNSNSDNKASVKANDDFIIHSNIMFGDTKEEVIKKETLEYQEEIEHENGVKRILYGGEIAGYDNSILSYWYDNDRGVFEATYAIYPNSNNDDYNVLLEALTEKYGEKLDENNSIYKTVEQEKKSSIENLKKSGIIYKLNVWDVKCNGYDIIIEYICQESKSNIKCYINYIKYTSEEIKEITGDTEEKDKKLLDDL